ncbi:Syntaxin-binding protein 5 [Xenoophorus captivus]|uniref:Syntaxin-binding protein 5 n=1 Tax=Xenoophorus captivus TaxID=1517983 RepID=A0ABV0QD00_9TELE
MQAYTKSGVQNYKSWGPVHGRVWRTVVRHGGEESLFDCDAWKEHCRPGDGLSYLMLQVLYKLKTAKVFERTRGKEEKPNTDIVDEDPFAIQTLFWCPESRMLCVAGVSAHVIIYRFSKQEVTTDVLLEVRMQCEFGEVDSPDPGGEQTPTLPTSAASSSPQEAEPPNQLSAGINSSEGPRDNIPCLQVRSSPLKQSPGYQVELVVQLVWVSGEPPQQITSLAVNSSFGLVVFGNSNGLAVVDYVQKTLLLHMGTSELYSPCDPCQRQPRSPRKPRQPSGGELRSTNYTRLIFLLLCASLSIAAKLLPVQRINCICSQYTACLLQP